MASDETTKCERAAMWLFGEEYSRQSLSVRDYWAGLSRSRKELVRFMLHEIDACEQYEREVPDAR